MRIAISGTYGTGKSTLARALSKRTGLSLVGARGMRDLLADHFGGKPLSDCTPLELVELGMRRFEERIATEAAAQGSFVSDGSTLNEWAYGLARRTHGIHPGDNSIRGAPQREREMFDAVSMHMNRVFRDHASQAYDLVVHLPIEFPLNSDGHRPVSADYRRFTNELLAAAPHELGLQLLEVHGSIEARVRDLILLLA